MTVKHPRFVREADADRDCIIALRLESPQGKPRGLVFCPDQQGLNSHNDMMHFKGHVTSKSPPPPSTPADKQYEQSDEFTPQKYSRVSTTMYDKRSCCPSEDKLFTDSRKNSRLLATVFEECKGFGE